MGKRKEVVEDPSKSKYELMMEELNRSYGKGTVFTLGSKQAFDEYDVISTGSVGFDYIALGVGGFVRGKLYELMGWEGVGKSTICGHLAANCQLQGGLVAYIDAEHAFDPKYFQALGVDLDTLVFSQPDFGEEGFQITEKMIEKGIFDLIILDSDSSLTPKASQVEGEIGDSAIGKKARLNNMAYPRLKSRLVKHNTCLIVVSQYREKIGVMFGNPTTTQGGHTLKYYADCRIEISKSVAKHGDVPYGNKTTVKSTKNKTYPPYRKAEFDIIWGEGIDKVGEIIELADEFGVAKKSGKSIIYNTVKYDLENFKVLLQDNPELFDEIRTLVIKKIRSADTSVQDPDLSSSEEAPSEMLNEGNS